MLGHSIAWAQSLLYMQMQELWEFIQMSVTLNLYVIIRAASYKYVDSLITLTNSLIKNLDTTIQKFNVEKNIHQGCIKLIKR